MSKVRRSTVGITAKTAKIAPAVAPSPSAAQAPTREQKPKVVGQRTAREKRSATLTVQSTVEKTVYTREEAALYLGTSPVTLWRIAQVGEDRDGKQLGHTRIGARVRFLREDLDRYARNEAPRAGAQVGWTKDEERAERMRKVHAARKT